jgi:hypothetical protein
MVLITVMMVWMGGFFYFVTSRVFKECLCALCQFLFTLNRLLLPSSLFLFQSETGARIKLAARNKEDKSFVAPSSERVVSIQGSLAACVAVVNGVISSMGEEGVDDRELAR